MRFRVLRTVLNDGVRDGQRFVALALRLLDRRDAQLRVTLDALLARDPLQDAQRIIRAPHPRVVVRERELPVRRHRRERLEVRLGEGGTPGAEIQQRQRAPCERIVGIELQGRLQLALGAVRIAARPIEIRERQMRVDGFRVQIDRLLKRLLCRIFGARPELNGSERRIRRRIFRIQRDRLLHLLDRPVRIVQTGERIPQQDVRLRACGFVFQRELRSGLRLIELAREQQQRSRLQLGIEIRGIEVRGLRVFAVRLHRIVRCRVDLCELVVQVSARWQQLQRVAVLNRRLRPLVLRGVRVALVRVLLGGLNGILMTGGENDRRTDDECASAHGRYAVRSGAMPLENSTAARSAAAACRGSCGTTMRTSDPFVRCNRAASSISHNLLA